MTVPARNVYSPQRLKVVLVLLTLVTLPVVGALRCSSTTTCASG